MISGRGTTEVELGLIQRCALDGFLGGLELDLGIGQRLVAGVVTLVRDDELRSLAVGRHHQLDALLEVFVIGISGGR